MASFGVRKSKLLGNGYESDPIREFAQSFANSVQSVVSEAGFNYYKDPSTALMDRSVENTLRKFFVEGSYDPTGMSPVQIESHTKDMNNLFENDIEGFNESTNVGSINALIGMSLPMHKNTLMNMVFDKGAIPKEVAINEKFTRTMERRLLVKPDGTELDMFKNQNELTNAMRSVNPFIAVDLTLPEIGATNIVTAHLNGAAVIDHIDIDSYIGAVKVDDVFFEIGDILPDADGVLTGEGTAATVATTLDTWFPVELRFKPGYGEIKRQLMSSVKIATKKESGTVAGTAVAYVVDDIVSGSMIKDTYVIQSLKSQISAVRMMAKLDASNRTIETCTVKWDEITDIVEIGTDEGINTTVSPEEVKDISSLYNVNQLTKVMSMMKTVLANRKDDYIKSELDLSYKRLDSSSKFHGVFDYAPREGYMLDHEEWRHKTFFAYFDSQVTKMLRALNDPNMSISVFGEPDLIRRITPAATEYTYQTPANIGPVELDFTKTVVTSDRRVYQFIGSDKLRDDNQLILTLCPRNTNRIIYVIYDYQMYISNEIRQNSNPALPNICAFERYKFSSYQPIQGRIDIVNPTGIRSNDGSQTQAF